MAGFVHTASATSVIATAMTEYPTCHSAVRLVAFSTQASVIDQILTHRRPRAAHATHDAGPPRSPRVFLRAQLRGAVARRSDDRLPRRLGILRDRYFNRGGSAIRRVSDASTV
jgi:hypothetical protein